MKSEAINTQFSRDEYILLLDVVGTAVDRLVAVADSLSPDSKAFVETAARLEQQLLEAAAKVGESTKSTTSQGSALVQRDEESGQWVPRTDVSDRFFAHEIVALHDEDFFWDELAQRLADQTAQRRVGSEKWDQLGGRERSALVEAEFDGIANHLTEHGIERMFFVEDNPHG